VTGTATSRPPLLLAACLSLTAAGCGGAGRSASSAATSRGAPAVAAAPSPGGFASLKPRAAPASWRSQRIPNGAILFYPPGWRLTRGDRGTATAEAVGANGRIVGYLNITPRQRTETLADWTSFRIAHNIDEGERSVRREATMTGVPFRSGFGTCVRDSYTTSTGARYVELACLVQGAKTSSVIIAAAPSAGWPHIAPLLERSVSALLS
jgi:hypothetical protein